ncbi:MAG: CBS domain-containing protein [Armatimonadetes bacterium]|nr:CBS domain-containing protein [Armatimonadota bacterium]
MKTVADIMTRKVITVPETMPVRELARLLVSKMLSGVPVVDAEGKLSYSVHDTANCRNGVAPG